MKALVMAAGLGTRLRPYTEHTPKAMLPVQGKPLIEHLIERLVAAGIVELSINLHHLGEQIAEHLGDGSTLGAHIRYAQEPELLETGGTIVKALPWLGQNPFLVVNADIYTDFDFTTLPRTLRRDDLGHLVLLRTPDWRDAGDFDFANGRVVRRGQSYVYCSIGVLSPALFESAPAGPFSWRDLMFQAVADGRMGGQVFEGHWYDIGSREQYEAVR